MSNELLRTVALDDWLRPVAFLGDILLVGYFLKTVLATVLVTGPNGHWMASRLARAAFALVRRIGRWQSRVHREDTQAWVLPVFMIMLIICWFVMALMGFAMVIWSLQAEHGVVPALIASGSALSTLGFLTPPDLSGRVLAIIEGAFGLGIVVFFFTFLPSYQSTVQARESKVAWLYARTGATPSATALLLWAHEERDPADLSAIWSVWEDWFRALAETHPVMPVVSCIPSVHRGQSWLLAATTMLDAASFSIALQIERRPGSAMLCYQAGVQAVRRIALGTGRGSARAGNGHAVAAPAAAAASRADFDGACGQIAAAGVTVTHDRDEAWRRFTALRAEYMTNVLQIACQLRLSPEMIGVLSRGEIEAVRRC